MASTRSGRYVDDFGVPVSFWNCVLWLMPVAQALAKAWMEKMIADGKVRKRIAENQKCRLEEVPPESGFEPVELLAVPKPNPKLLKFGVLQLVFDFRCSVKGDGETGGWVVKPCFLISSRGVPDLDQFKSRLYLEQIVWSYPITIGHGKVYTQGSQVTEEELHQALQMMGPNAASDLSKVFIYGKELPPLTGRVEVYDMGGDEFDDAGMLNRRAVAVRYNPRADEKATDVLEAFPVGTFVEYLAAQTLANGVRNRETVFRREVEEYRQFYEKLRS